MGTNKILINIQKGTCHIYFLAIYIYIYVCVCTILKASDKKKKSKIKLIFFILSLL